VVGNVLGVTAADLWLSAAVGGLVLLLIGLFYQELLIASFDRLGAGAMGLSVFWLDVLLLLLTDARNAGGRETMTFDTPAPLADESVCDREMDFERKVAQYLPPVLRIARRVMGSEDLAWDAAQESLLCLWHRSGRGR
jgi:ABC 3 transport family/Sigma-70 region 2